MAAKTPSKGTRAALIGLIATLLTVCGGVSGALISAAVTVYRVEREAQSVALAAPAREEPLRIDTGSIYISPQQAAALDLQTYSVHPNQGLVIRHPLPGWNELEELTFEEAAVEGGVQTLPEPPLSEQPVFRVRYGDPIEVQTDQQTLLNGESFSQDALHVLEELYGPPPWTEEYYSQVVVNVFERPVVEDLGADDLADLLLMVMNISASRVNDLIAEPESDFMMVQSSTTYERVKMAGHPATFTVESWLLLAETEAAYYALEITFTPQSGQSIQVWEDLQLYMDSFRVIR